MTTQTLLTGDDSIKTWLSHPVGGPIIREMLAQGGQDADALKPVSRLALKRLIKLSKGQFSQEMVDGLVARVASGDVPAGTPVAAVSDDAETAVPVVELEEWV